MAKRVYDKINCPTNFTSPKTFAVLLDAVKTAGTLTSERARTTVFPQARSAVSRYNPENKDTHGEGTLRTYGLIENVPDTAPVEFRISPLGSRFLECFERDSEGQYLIKSNNEYNYNSILLDALLFWTDTSGSKRINPGWVMLKLLSDARLDYYITDYEWAYFCERSDYRNTKDYDKLVETLITLRSGDIKEQVQPRNAYAFMVGFSGDWDILFRKTENESNCFYLKDITKRNLREKMLRLESYARDVVEIDKDEATTHNFYGMHITNKNSAAEDSEISIGWSKIGDLTSVGSKEELSGLYEAAYPTAKPRSKAQGVAQIWTFKDSMAVGDYVVWGDGNNAHFGIIKSDYYYEINTDARDEDYVNNRKVEWIRTISYLDLPKLFKSALASARSVFSLNAYKSIILELIEKGTIDIDEELDEDEDETMEEQKPRIDLNFETNVACDFERNRIVFGAPGTGKSFQLEEDKKSILALGGNYERVTFHPDFTYSAFVGCYKPVSEKGEIKYKYVPGPFMRVLVDALRSGIEDEQAKPFLLLIEEINRAKVAAVFGEVFQLLDRNSVGASDYEIHASEDVKKYLSDELNGSLDSFDRIKIPNNMFIWASMNSADQGVFPMDTAFKRRWSFEYKGIDENEDKVGGLIVLGKGESAIEINWNTLRKAINTTLATKYGINEDKLMGPFFIGEEVFAFGEDGKMLNPAKFIKVFKSKVIMYLYEDAAKQQKHKLFSGCDSSRYSSICDAFEEIGIEIFGADFKTTYDEIKEAEASR